jgi:hypothetical protein
MSKSKNQPDKLFITPIDDLYEKEPQEEENSFEDSFSNIKGIISGINGLMQCNEKVEDILYSPEENVSTNSNSPIEKYSKRVSCKQVILTTFLKKTWKESVQGTKEDCLTKLLADSIETILYKYKLSTPKGPLLGKPYKICLILIHFFIF